MEPRAIVIGAGPSIYKQNHLRRIADSNFEGFLFISDSMLKPCLQNNITPDKFKMIVCTLEDFLPVFALPYFDGAQIRLWAPLIRIVKAKRVRPAVIDILEKQGFMIETTEDPEINISCNVGLMCWKLASLVCNKVALVGIDHAFDESYIPPAKQYDDIYKSCFEEIENPYTNQKLILNPLFISWRIEFLELIEAKRVKTYNCTGGGSIFGRDIEYLELEDFIGNN